MKKTIYNLLVIVSFLTCFYPNTGKGQEFIVEFLSLKHYYSIIRESGFSQWLLCNNYDGLQIIALADLSGTANYIARGDEHFPYQQENCTTDNITYCNVLKLQKSNCHTLSDTPDSYTTSLINWNANYWLEAIICP